MKTNPVKTNPVGMVEGGRRSVPIVVVPIVVKIRSICLQQQGACMIGRLLDMFAATFEAKKCSENGKATNNLISSR